MTPGDGRRAGEPLLLLLGLLLVRRLAGLRAAARHRGAGLDPGGRPAAGQEQPRRQHRQRGGGAGVLRRVLTTEAVPLFTSLMLSCYYTTTDGILHLANITQLTIDNTK